MAEVPIPARLAGRPVQAGLVVPVVSVALSDGRAMFGQMHTSKAGRCIADNLCQACGEKLTRPAVVFVTAATLATRYSPEPALHPECAAYAAKACPMLAGQMARYRSAPSPHLGMPCDTPGCNCDGWVATDPGKPTKAGQPAERWVAVWLTSYAVAVNDAGEVHGLVWLDEPLKVRPLVTAADDPTRPADQRCTLTELAVSSCAHCRNTPDAPLSRELNGHWFEASFGGSCAACGERFGAGQRIRRDGAGGYLGECCGKDDE